MNKQQKSITTILIIFLLGIFMGALDSGIVSPAREIIQNTFGVEAGYGTWMITIYTLFYAVSMPIVSKLADRFGYKPVYIVGIGMFGIGSLLAGLANFYGTFEFFLVARVIQAVGSGGIIPIANAVIGQSFPEEKRGFALGMVGGVYGIATILGPSVGSGILQLVGTGAWGWLFYINVPISIVIIFMSMGLENKVAEEMRPMDLMGSVVLTGVIGSLMYALTKLDLFNVVSSFKDINVWPFLLIFVLLLPVLILVEKKAKDPILNLKYFTNPQILLTMIIGFFVGVGMMGMVFVPQFGENVLRLKAGTGGYLITLLAVFSGVAAPISGKLIDKRGARVTLMVGFAFTIIGTLWMALVVTKALSFLTLFVGLAFMGLGVGFTMGAPLNYLILKSVPKQEGTTALATLSVIRSIGVTISPSLMIGFIVAASKTLQENLMNVLNDAFAAYLPKGMSMTNMASGSGAFDQLKSADVTTITDLLNSALGANLPEKIKPVVSAGIEQNRLIIENTFQMTINNGYQMMFIASAIIAGLGLLTTLLLKEKRTEPETNLKEINEIS